MDRLQAMEVFARVVEANSFSRASDSLDLSRTSVTTIVKSLEAHLRTPLLQRTTRKLKLTPEGAEYYEHCVRILAEISETEAAMAGAGRGPRGKLRVDMPATIGKWVVTPHLYRFHELYPDVELIVGYGDKLVDLIQDGVDCAIRVGELQDSTLIARRLADMQTITVASPQYLHRHGLPRTLDDLERHMAIHYISSKTNRAIPLSFTVDGRMVEVQVPGKLGFNDADAYVECGLTGTGILQPPRFMVGEHLRSGALVEILPQWRPRSLPISAIYPQSRHLAPKVRVFVEWVLGLFEASPLFTPEAVRRAGGGASIAQASVAGASDVRDASARDGSYGLAAGALAPLAD